MWLEKDLVLLFFQHTSTEMVSPLAYIDTVTFEMHKTYKETRLQLIVSPITIIVSDTHKVC